MIQNSLSPLDCRWGFSSRGSGRRWIWRLVHCHQTDIAVLAQGNEASGDTCPVSCGWLLTTNCHSPHFTRSRPETVSSIPTSVQITLVDKSDRFTFKPLLYELLNSGASEDEVAPFFSQLLAPYPIRFVQSRVSGVEPDRGVGDGAQGGGGGVVQLQDGASIE